MRARGREQGARENLLKLLSEKGYNQFMVIDEKEVRHLAELAKVSLKEGDESRLVKDLGKILDHFEELREIDTENVEPMNGGNFGVNVHRHDDESIIVDTSQERLLTLFPEKESDYLKIPPVFE